MEQQFISKISWKLVKSSNFITCQQPPLNGIILSFFSQALLNKIFWILNKILSSGEIFMKKCVGKVAIDEYNTVHS